MTKKRISVGQCGEEASVRYLQKKGFRVLQRNFRCKIGELDIVAMDGTTLVFIEVRTVTGATYGTAQESVSKTKIQRLQKLAAFFIQSKNAANLPVRFDVLAVTIHPERGVQTIDHIVNAF